MDGYYLKTNTFAIEVLKTWTTLAVVFSCGVKIGTDTTFWFVIFSIQLQGLVFLPLF